MPVAFTWTDQRTRAAQLVARGYSAPKTAAEVGCDEKTIDRWNQIQEFRDRVDEEKRAYRLTIRQSGLAIREERIRHLKTRHAMLRKIVAKRAKDPIIQRYLSGTYGADLEPDAVAEVAADVGPEAGLICVKWKGKEANQPEFAVDTGLLAEFRALEEQIAIETGEWKGKPDADSGIQKVTSQVIFLATILSPDEVEQFLLRANAAVQVQAGEGL